MNPEESQGVQPLRTLYLVTELKCTCDRAEVLTWFQRSQHEDVNPDGELYDGNCIQDARNPFLLHHYRISSVMKKVSECIQVGGGG